MQGVVFTEQIAEEKSRAIYVKSRELEESLRAENRMKNEVELLLNALEAFTSKLEISEIAEESLLERSDGALYQAKKAGRNRTVIYGTSLQDPQQIIKSQESGIDGKR